MRAAFLEQPIRMCLCRRDCAADVWIEIMIVLAVRKRWRRDFFGNQGVSHRYHETARLLELLVSKFQDRNALLHARAGTEDAGNN